MLRFLDLIYLLLFILFLAFRMKQALRAVADLRGGGYSFDQKETITL
jgi:hypothetical protein